MIEEIQDTRALTFLSKKIAEKNSESFRSTRYCGYRLVHQLGIEPMVYVLSDKEQAKFFGTAHCGNSWYCPVCAPRNMAKHAQRIAAAIEALKKEHQLACMITFTIPHTRGMSCKETTEILFNSWKKFIIHGNKNQHQKYYANKKDKKYKHNEEKVLTVSARKLSDTFSSFCEHFSCIHRVRVGEFTYGQAGWHPHFHCLFWVDEKKIDEVAEWQDALLDRWLTIVKRETLKTWNRLYPDKQDDNKTRLDIMYSRLNEGSKAVYVSVDKNGKVIRQQSSMYICGWGADRELTGNLKNKASNEGHLTPYQILEKAQRGDNQMLNLYFEFMQTVAEHRYNRVKFSTRTGIKQIIDNYLKTQEYRETLKKKCIQRKWQLVYWFTEQQWLQICQIECFHNYKIKFHILELATLPNAAELIEFFLNLYDIKTRNKECRYKKLIEEVFAA